MLHGSFTKRSWFQTDVTSLKGHYGFSTDIALSLFAFITTTADSQYFAMGYQCALYAHMPVPKNFCVGNISHTFIFQWLLFVD